MTQKTKKKIMAFYYPWYGNPKHSRKWVRWNESDHKPPKDLPAAHNPRLGAYDSTNPEVLKQHFKWAEEAGIDVLISSYWNYTFPQTKKNLKKVMKAANNSKVKIAIYYEEPKSYDPRKQANHFIKIIRDCGKNKSYLKIKGKPVIFIFSRMLLRLGEDKWEKIIRLVNKKEKCLFIADTKEKSWIRLFDGAHRYNIIDSLMINKNMEKEYKKYVNQVKKQEKISCATIVPGYDDSGVKGLKKEFAGQAIRGLYRNFSIKRFFKLLKNFFKRIKNREFKWILLTFGLIKTVSLKRNKGTLYKKLFKAAIKSNPDWILITSFNEWFEGTEIEPSKEHGKKYLQLTKKYSMEFNK